MIGPLFFESVVMQLRLPAEGVDNAVKHGSEIEPGEPAAERQDHSRLRDTLLPKLIFGELRVKDAARFVEFAA